MTILLHELPAPLFEDLPRSVSTQTEVTMAKPHASDSPPDRSTPSRILLAEDDHEMRTLLASQLRRAGYEVVECRDGERLVQQLGSTFLPSVHQNHFDLVISDIRMPGFSGLEVLDGLHDRTNFPPMMLITAFGDPETHARARKLGAVATLDKPFRISDLIAVVQRFFKTQRHEAESGEQTPAPGAASHPITENDNDNKEDER